MTTHQIVANEAGDYYMILTEVDCNYPSDTRTVTVYPNPEIPIISTQGNLLLSTFSVSYQWYLDGEPITGATTQTIEAMEEGEYQVRIANEYGCERFSEPFNFALVSAENLKSDGWLRIFPNPTDGLITIQTHEGHLITVVNIYNSVGRLVYHQPDHHSVVDASHLPTGVYVLEVWIREQPVYGKMVIR